MRDAVSHPNCVIPVATYAQLDLFVRAFADAFFNLLVLIAKEWKAFNVNVAALQDRGQVVHFLPSGLELHRRTAHWFWDQEIFDFVGQYLHLIAQPSMRHYLAAWELKQAQMDWRQLILNPSLSAKALLVAHLNA